MSTPGVVNFPTTLDDAVSLIEYANNASATLSSGISSSALLIPVSAPSEFSDSGVVTIVDSLTNPTVIEIVIYTSKSGSDLVVPAGGRGAQGTTPSAFNAGAVVEQRPTARGFTVLADAIIAMQNSGRTGMYSNTSAGTAVANTVTETSLFTGATASAGSSRTIAAGSAKAGSVYSIRIVGGINTTGTPTVRFRLYLGATLIADTGAFNAPTNGDGVFAIDLNIFVSGIGVGGSVTAFIEGRATVGAGASAVTLFNSDIGATGVDFTANQTIDVTAQWGTASASNSIQLLRSLIGRDR